MIFKGTLVIVPDGQFITRVNQVRIVQAWVVVVVTGGSYEHGSDFQRIKLCKLDKFAWIQKVVHSLD